jgi:hypothetical protein
MRYFLNTFLDSPILSTYFTRVHAEMILSHVTMRRTGRLTESMRKVLRSVHDTALIRALLEDNVRLDRIERYDSDMFPIILNSFEDRSVLAEAEEAHHTAQDIFLSALEGLSSYIPAVRNSGARKISPEEREWTCRAHYWEAAIDGLEFACAKGRSRFLRRHLDDGTLYMTPELAVLVRDGHGVMLPYNAILSIKDAAIMRRNTFVAESIFYQSAELRSSIVALYRWQERCLSVYGNRGYEIAKSTESAFKSYLSVVSNDLLAASGPFPRMIEKIRDKERSFGAVRFLADELESICRSVTRFDHAVELFGLQKLTGHPLIDPLVGGKSSAAEARTRDETTDESANRIKWNFCRMYLEARLRKTGRWTPLVFSREGTTLEALFRARVSALPRSAYPLEDWRYARFAKHEEFEYYDNFLEVMDDKSISFYRSDRARTWDRGPIKSNRRLLLEMINREEINIREIVKLVTLGLVPEDWFIVSLYPKEREFKLAARMFCMLVLEIRCFFAVTEANLAEFIFPYLPQQTMTRDKLSVHKMFLALSDPRQRPGLVRLFLEIDLSRWNLRWRELTVHRVGDALDDIFGLPGVFTFVHTFFSRALVMVRVADLRPTGIEQEYPPESDLVWYNHLGGFEGIAQKHWTLCTYSMVDLAVSGMVTRYTLIGQGDNQVLSVEVPRDETYSEQQQLEILRDQLTRRVATECARVNQLVKPEECLESTSVITYSKDVYGLGVDYATTLKAHSRIIPRVATDFPSLWGRIGAIFASGSASAERTKYPIGSYQMCLYIAARDLVSALSGRLFVSERLCHEARRRGFDRAQFIKHALTRPSGLGGMPIPGIASFIYRGGSDPLSRDVASLHVMARSHDPLYSRMLRDAQDGIELDPNPRASALIEDPYSAPFRVPVTPTDAVSRDTTAILRGIVRNRPLRELLAAETQDYESSLVTALLSVRPFNPVLLHDVLDASIVGVVRMVEKAFVATRSITSLARVSVDDDEREVSLVEKLLHANDILIAYLAQSSQRVGRDRARALTIYDTVVRLRQAWRRAGVEPEGVTSYHPLDFEWSYGDSAMAGRGVRAVLTNTVDPHDRRGVYDPYLGNRTVEKKAEQGYRIIGRNPPERAVRKLQTILSQSGGDRSFATLLDTVALTRTGVTISDLHSALPRIIGGTIGHRYAARVGERSAHLLGVSTLATHCVVNTDDVGYLAGGQDDYPVMFQEFMLSCLAALSLSQVCGRPEVVVRIALSEGQLDVLPDERLVCDVALVPPPRTLRQNPLVYVEEPTLVKATGPYSRLLIPMRDVRTAAGISRGDTMMILKAAYRRVLMSAGGRTALELGRTPSDFSFDLLEVRNASVGLHICAAAAAVASRVTSALIAEPRRSRVRWDPIVVVRNASQLCAQLIVRHLGSPLFSRDRDVVELGLQVGMRYRGHSTTDALDRTASAITSLAYKGLDSPSSAVMRIQDVVCPDDNEFIVSEIMREQMNTALYHAYTRHELSEREAFLLSRRWVEHTLSGLPTSESMRAAALAVSAGQLSAWARVRGLPLLEDRMRNIDEQRTIVQLACSLREAVRELRSITATYRRLTRDLERPMLAPVTRPKVTVTNAIRLDANSRDCYTLRASLVERYTESRGRRHGLMSTGVYLWHEFADVFSGRAVHVIGCGHGAAAAIALDAGAVSVHAVDLLSDFDEVLSSLNRTPPCVAQLGYDNFAYHPEVVTHAGDWRDGRCSSRIAARLSQQSVVVLDIDATGSERSPLLDLLPLMHAPERPHCVLLRVRRSPIVSRQLAGDVTASGGLCALYVSSLTSVLVITRLPRVIHTYFAVVGGEQLLCDARTDMSRFGGGRTLLLNEILGPAASQERLTVSKHLRAVRKLIMDLHGEHLVRLNFKAWEHLLAAEVSLRLLLESESERISHLETLDIRGFDTISIGPWSTTVTLTPEVRRIILHGARLV